MKTIYKTLVAVAVSFLLIPAASAQTTVPYYINEENGIAYNKYVKDGPDAQGRYTLHLETFATGEVTKETRAVPSDIVLVLDNSGSMYYAYIKPGATLESQMALDVDFSYYSYNNGYPSVKADGTGGGTGTPIRIFSTEGPRFYLYNGKYYKVEGGGNTTNGYYLRFKLEDGTYKYLDNTSLVDTAPTTYKKQNSVIYREKLYSYPTRKAVLESSVKRFIQLINENNQTLELEDGQMGNRLAIVAFGSQYYQSPSSETSVEEYTGNGASNNCFVLKGLTPIGDLVSITNPLAKMTFRGSTTMDFGTSLARRLLEAQEAAYPVFDDEGVQIRSRSVVLFTDGTPNHNKIDDAHPAWSFWKIATACINDSYTIKQDLHGKFFSIALTPLANYVPFMQHLSSNYPTAKTTLSDGGLSDKNKNSFSGNIITPAVKQIYYMDAGLSDLTKIFEAIASYTGGGNTDVSSTSIAAIDLVANSFTLPEGTSVADVKVYTAQCLGVTGESWTDSKGNSHPYLAFADPVSAEGDGCDPVESLWVATPVVDEHGDPVMDDDDNPKYEWTEKKNVDIDGTLSIVPDTDNNTVTVTGFNYGENWCGLDPDVDHVNTEQYNSADYPETYQYGYRGFKIIIEFPIQVKDGALGGANVPTNLEGSGLYDKDGNTLIEYPRPVLPIPVNLWIQKKGLEPGESASFTILYKRTEPTTDDPNPTYKPFTRLVLTGSADGSPVMGKLLNLDPSFYYKIWEEGWSWAYSNQAQDQGTAPSTEDDELKNPIVIENTPKDDTPKHAEANKRNVME